MIILRMFKFKLSQLKTENASLGFKEKQQCIFSMADKLETNKTGLTASHVATCLPGTSARWRAGERGKLSWLNCQSPVYEMEQSKGLWPAGHPTLRRQPGALSRAPHSQETGRSSEQGAPLSGGSPQLWGGRRLSSGARPEVALPAECSGSRFLIHASRAWHTAIQHPIQPNTECFLWGNIFPSLHWATYVELL